MFFKIKTKNKGVKMENKNRLIKIGLAILAIITTICISIDVVNGSFYMAGNDFKWIIILSILYILLNKAVQNSSKRLIICSSIFGLITSICAITGYTAERYLVDNLYISKKEMMLLFLKLEVCFVTITSIAMIIMKSLPNIMKKIRKKKELSFFTANKKSILIVAIILFIAYLPYLLYYYPGNVLIDSTVQIMQGMGDWEFTAHHPPIHTAIITLCVKLGGLIGSYNFGAFIYTLLQTLTTCFLFSFAIYYMAKKQVPVSIRVCSILFYALCPTISFLTITMYKDIPFALAMLALTICMTEIATNLDNFMKHKLRIALFIISVFLVAIFRNNGLYAMILGFPIILIMVKKYKVKIGLMIITGIAICMIITGPIYNLCGIGKGSSKEAFSVILQQFARLTKYKNEELTQQEKDAIHKYLPVDNLDELYNPVFSDPVKHQFSDEAFAQDKITLIKTYLQLAIKYPMHTIASIICNSFGYYYPNTLGWGVYTGVNEECFADKNVDYGICEKPLVNFEALDKVNEFVNSRNIPIISMFLSIGFLFWVLVFGIIYCIYEKKYNLLIIYVPIVCMWITILASPVFGEPRYVYSLFTCLPLLIGITLNKSYKLDNEEENEELRCQR